MDRADGRSLVEIIGRAIEEARRRGRDADGQFDNAVAAVLVAEPSLSPAAIRRLVATLCS